MNKIDLVFFYNPPPFSYHKYSFFDQLNDTLKINRQYFNKTILVTTDKSINKIQNIDFIHHMLCESLDEVHFNRIKSWADYSNSNFFLNDSVLLDADIVFNENIDYLFKNNFSIAISTQTTSSSPINAGLILLNKNKKEIISKNFFNILEIGKKIKHLKDSRFPNIERSAIWGLDEFALNVYLSQFFKEKTDIKEFIKNLKIESISPFFNEISFLAENIGIDYKYLDKEKIRNYPAIHFNGNSKQEMKKYIDSIIDN